MRTYDAIDKISEAIIQDGLCDAIVIKGSIGRGDDDEYSDVDLYAVVKEDRMQEFLDKRLAYLQNYMPVVYTAAANFVAEQLIVIYENGLHVDLYAVTVDTLPHKDKAKIIYDPDSKLINYIPEIQYTSIEQIIATFHDTLYYFVEADSAYCRKNYPWAMRIMDSCVSGCAVLLRYLYDKEYTYLGLKKINEVIPQEQFSWLVEASAHLDKDGFQIAIHYLIKILDFVVVNLEESVREKLNHKFFYWIKENVNVTLFVKEK